MFMCVYIYIQFVSRIGVFFFRERVVITIQRPEDVFRRDQIWLTSKRSLPFIALNVQVTIHSFIFFLKKLFMFITKCMT
jgi:hypothetical protein